MHTENPRVLENLIKKYLPPYITQETLEIPEWKTYTGRHVAPNTIELDDAPAQNVSLGFSYDVGYDDTRFFEAEVTVPESFAGKKVYLTLDFGGEAIVRINGKIAGAVSSREHGGWVCRDDILFPEPFKGGERLAVQCENTVDCGSFCDPAMAGATHMTYHMKTAALRLINEDAQALWYDMSCAWDIQKNTEDRYTAKRLYNAIDSAMHMLVFDLGKEKFYASIPAAREYFRKETEKIRFATPGDVLLCGHSHLDIAWLWTVRELNRKTARTFSNNLALMENYPDFKFTQSQALVYQFMKDRYPEIFERVREKVRSGQWEITGNAWVEADTNIASGESLIRQLLLGREFFMKEFGVSSDIYWLPDCFGFSAALPQIIKKSGMKYFVTSKLQNNDTNEFPASVFKWRSHSGDEILAYMQKVGYGGEADANYIVRTRSSNRQNDLVDASMGMYGYGDGGGGCTYDMLERVRRMSTLPGLPKVRTAHAKEFFAQIEPDAAELPVWDGEMYYENHRGTYTSQAFVKKNNRRGEFAMRNLEMLSLLGDTVDAEELDRLWKVLLQNQFHDILPGTSIHEVFVNTRQEYEEFFRDVSALTEKALSALEAKVGRRGGVTVWNLNTDSVTNEVSVVLPDGGLTFTDEDGKQMPTREEETENGFRYTFLAENVPGIGFRNFFPVPKKTALPSEVICETNRLENRYLRVLLEENGLITSLVDKTSGRELLNGRGNLLTLSHDKPIHESAWNLESDYKMSMVPVTELADTQVIKNDEVGGILRQTRKINSSVITQDIVLNRQSRTLEFRTTVDWHEKEKVLKAEFPLALHARYATYNIAHGAIERPTYANNSFEKAMFECCAHKWADVSVNSHGISLLNDCKYGYDIRDDVMRITLMRAPVCPDPTADLGINTFTYALYPHNSTWANADTTAEAFRLNDPLIAHVNSIGGGTLPEGSVVKVNTSEPGEVTVDAIKPAQDQNGIILRFNEANGMDMKATVTLPIDFAEIRECDMVENPLPDAAPVCGREFSFEISPFEVKTFRLR